MSNKTTPEVPTPISCEVCLKEIPASAGTTMETDDYIYHFCGTDCYQQWQQQQEQKDQD